LQWRVRLQLSLFANVMNFFLIPVTSVEERVAEIGIPKQYSLSANYPNPFNPTTKIRYELPKRTKVRLRIYDLLSREVATLVDQEKPAGSYEVRWDASGFASGVYFYRLQAGGFVETKKLVLLK